MGSAPNVDSRVASQVSLFLQDTASNRASRSKGSRGRIIYATKSVSEDLALWKGPRLI